MTTHGSSNSVIARLNGKTDGTIVAVERAAEPAERALRRADRQQPGHLGRGARLDLASHDGRYSFAALKTGAAHVTGVEVRQTLLDRAQEAFAVYGQDPETYRFVRGDVFEVLAREKFDVDVVLCFGFLHHSTGTRN